MSAEKRLAALAKPPHSLGVLEDWAILLCKLQNTLSPSVDSVSILVFCADHGIKKADSRISPFPASVTQAVFFSLAAGLSGTSVLAKSVGAHLTVVDCGIDGDVRTASSNESCIDVLHLKVACGTADSRSAPAMTEEQMNAALQVGRKCVADEISNRGACAVCIGEVGIGNTTSAAALLVALTGADASECCGRGTGLDDAGVQNKVTSVRKACSQHAIAIQSNESAEKQAQEALRTVGGLEFAAMVGAYMEAADKHIVAVVDGFISGVAALCAAKIQPACRENMIFATNLAEEPSSTKGGEILTAALKAKAALSMDLALGETSGAALAVPLLRSAAAIITRMGTLEEVQALVKT